MKKTSPSTVASSNNPWFAVAMVLLGVIGGFLVANIMNAGAINLGGLGQQIGGAQAPTPPVAPPAQPASAGDVLPVDPSVDRIRGNPNANIALVEYSDFECPFCTRVHATYKQVMDQYGDDVMWVYRHFPLHSIHPNAQKAAEASECAGDLGGNDAFWQYADMLFDRGATPSSFGAYAREIGLDEVAFNSCVDSGKFAEKVSRDLNSGTAAGVQGTPGNIIINIVTDERRDVPGAQPFPAFESAIEALR